MGLLSLGLVLVSAAVAGAAGTVTNCATYGAPSTVGTLAWALQGGGTVTFACSGTIVVPEVVITTNTKIDATGRTVALSGNNANRVLCVEGVRLGLVHSQARLLQPRRGGTARCPEDEQGQRGCIC